MSLKDTSDVYSLLLGIKTDVSQIVVDAKETRTKLDSFITNTELKREWCKEKWLGIEKRQDENVGRLGCLEKMTNRYAGGLAVLVVIFEITKEWFVAKLRTPFQ